MEDGSARPFSLGVGAPKCKSKHEYECEVSCPELKFEDLRIHGATKKQAMALSLWLIADQLRHRQLTLVDADGRPIDLPIDRDAGVPESTELAPG